LCSACKQGAAKVQLIICSAISTLLFYTPSLSSPISKLLVSIVSQSPSSISLSLSFYSPYPSFYSRYLFLVSKLYSLSPSFYSPSPSFYSPSPSFYFPYPSFYSPSPSFYSQSPIFYFPYQASILLLQASILRLQASILILQLLFPVSKLLFSVSKLIFYSCHHLIFSLHFFYFFQLPSHSHPSSFLFSSQLPVCVLYTRPLMSAILLCLPRFHPLSDFFLFLLFHTFDSPLITFWSISLHFLHFPPLSSILLLFAWLLEPSRLPSTYFPLTFCMITFLLLPQSHFLSTFLQHFYCIPLSLLFPLYYSLGELIYL
jgi:hypothetical protein